MPYIIFCVLLGVDSCECILICFVKFLTRDDKYRRSCLLADKMSSIFSLNFLYFIISKFSYCTADLFSSCNKIIYEYDFVINVSVTAFGTGLYVNQFWLT